MANGHELVSWTDEQWKAVQEGLEKALAGTAKCRQVVPRGSDQIGVKSVAVPVIAAGAAHVLLGVVHLERLAANGASKGNTTTLVIAVMLAAVLVEVQISALLTWVLSAWDNLATTAGAIAVLWPCKERLTLTRPLAVITALTC